MRYKVVIFDLDGTLLNTLEDIGNSCNKVIEVFGFTSHPIDAYGYFVGDGSRKLIERATNLDSKDPMVDCMLSSFKDVYTKGLVSKTSLYEGIPSMLDALENEGVILNILSNKIHTFLQSCTQEYLSSWSFAKVLGERDGIEKKPSPEAVLQIIADLGVSPKEVLFVGDTKTDMKTASNAKIDSCGVLWGFRDKKELEDYGATYIIEKPEELIPLVIGE